MRKIARLRDHEDDWLWVSQHEELSYALEEAVCGQC